MTQIKTTAILLMAGTGNRFGSAIPKQFHRLAGKKIYQHTLDRFIASQLFDEIILVCSLDRLEDVKMEVPSSIRVIAGGSTRQESSYKGLLACKDCTIVCIHDAVRPFVTNEILKENIIKAKEFGAIDTCIPSADTLVYAPGHAIINCVPLRKDFLRGQTPQTFRYSTILKAHQLAIEKDNFNRSDDCSLVLDTNHPVHIILGSEHNIKITTELDLNLAEQIFRLGIQKPACLSSNLAGKKYIVTGGTGGIGAVLCDQLKQEGAIAIRLSRTSLEYSADLTSYESTKHAFEKIHHTYGLVDGLINSIGTLKLGTLEQLSQEDIENQLSTNLKALIFACKCALLKNDADVVNIASSSYSRGRKDFSIYSCAKAAVVNFTQGLAEERPYLFINAIIPQRTKTAMRLQNFVDEDPHSLLDPQDVAREVIDLLKQKELKGSVIEIRKKIQR